MHKQHLQLSDCDKAFFKKAKIRCVGYGSIWVLLLLLLILVITLAFSPSFHLSDNDKLVIFILFGILSLLPLWGMYQYYGFYKIVTDHINANEKIILKATTRSGFMTNESNATQYFVNDETFYNFQTISFGPGSIGFKNADFLPF